jgi:hypothetical protein
VTQRDQPAWRRPLLPTPVANTLLLWPHICSNDFLELPAKSSAMALRRLTSMLGWMMMFTMMLLGGTLAAVMGKGTGQTAAIASSLVFGLLLVVSALTFTLRGRA